ncbi:cysteine proteinase [Testicularia cyperi]|uniref:Cysteine proteinase n=1 Tax=Testicularia cyperi TaxID=1882483 RepID=A0A317XS27_9BASI|nr:cysteine proteinase [Testicularia cyperi]
MPRKTKKAARPALGDHNDSLRRDLQTVKDTSTFSASADPSTGEENDNAFDIADDLLAALDARDAAEAAEREAKKEEDDSKRRNKPHSLRDAVSGILYPSHQNKESFATSSESHQPAEAIESTHQHQRKSSIRRIFGSSPKSSDTSTDLASAGPKKRMNRQQQRKERKAAEMETVRRQAEEEVKANGGQPDLAEIERQGINAMCQTLGVTMHEITPDGHCLYAAVADQLNLRRKGREPVDYKSTRRATANEMRSHPHEYKPFISDSDEHMAGIDNREAGTLNTEQAQEKHYMTYCDAVENTGVWGGQPEILALTRAFGTQINVIQAGVPILKVGEGEFEGEPLTISYHRKMYGLGEHYNSLRPAA